MKDMEKKVPMRTCVVCRKSFPKKELLRIVKSGDQITVDKTGRANGRGAYICTDAECAKKLKKQKILNKVFSCEVSDQTYAQIEETLSSGQ